MHPANPVLKLTVSSLYRELVGSVEILRELHVRRVIRRDEGPPEVANTPVY